MMPLARAMREIIMVCSVPLKNMMGGWKETYRRRKRDGTHLRFHVCSWRKSFYNGSLQLQGDSDGNSSTDTSVSLLAAAITDPGP